MKEQADSDSGVVGTRGGGNLTVQLKQSCVLDSETAELKLCGVRSRFKSDLSLFAVTSEANYE